MSIDTSRARKIYGEKERKKQAKQGYVKHGDVYYNSSKIGTTHTSSDGRTVRTNADGGTTYSKKEDNTQVEQQQSAPSSREHVDVAGVTRINNVDSNGNVSGLNISGSDKSKAGTTEYLDSDYLNRDLGNPTARTKITYDENGNPTVSDVSWTRPEERPTEHYYLGNSNSNPGQTNQQRSAIADYQRQHDEIAEKIMVMIGKQTRRCVKKNGRNLMLVQLV